MNYGTKPSYSESKFPTKYCSRCEQIINPVTKKCTGCGKQYFRGIPWQIIIPTFLAILLCCSMFINYRLHTNIVTLQEEINTLNNSVEFYEEYTSSLINEKNQYFNDWADSLEVLAFYNKHFVFVVDQETMTYHRYDCTMFQQCDSFYPYTINMAKDKGYEPCSICSAFWN